MNVVVVVALGDFFLLCSMYVDIYIVEFSIRFSDFSYIYLPSTTRSKINHSVNTTSEFN